MCEYEIERRKASYLLLKQIMRDIEFKIRTGNERRGGIGDGHIGQGEFDNHLIKYHQQLLKKWIKKEELKFRDVVSARRRRLMHCSY